MNRRLKWPTILIALLAIAGAPARAAEEPMPRYAVKDVAEMAALGRAAERVAGPGWKTSAEFVRALAGWDGRVNGEALTFTNDRLRVNGRAATFKIIRTDGGRPKLRPDAGPGADVALSAYRGFWYYSPGNYAAAYPQQWQKLLGRLRTFFGLPRAVDGVVCVLEPGIDILVRSGDPISMHVSLVKLPDTTSHPSYECRGDGTHLLVVTGPSGRRLTPKKTPAPKWEQRAYLGTIDVTGSFAMTTPGIYKVKVRCPLSKDKTRVAESREVSIQVTPKDYLTARLTPLFEQNALSPGQSLPVGLQLNVKEGGLKQFSELNIGYGAVRIIVPRKLWVRLYGSPGREMTRGILSELRSAGRGRYRMRLDLAAGKWNNGLSSAGPAYPIWNFLNAGEEWRIWATIAGKMGGRAFVLRCDELTLQIAAGGK